MSARVSLSLALIALLLSEGEAKSQDKKVACDWILPVSASGKGIMIREIERAFYTSDGAFLTLVGKDEKKKPLALLVDAKSGKEMRRYQPKPTGLPNLWSQDGTRFYEMNVDHQSYNVWKDGKLEKRVEFPKSTTSYLSSFDGGYPWEGRDHPTWILKKGDNSFGYDPTTAQVLSKIDPPDDVTTRLGKNSFSLSTDFRSGSTKTQARIAVTDLNKPGRRFEKTVSIKPGSYSQNLVLTDTHAIYSDLKFKLAEVVDLKTMEATTLPKSIFENIHVDADFSVSPDGRYVVLNDYLERVADPANPMKPVIYDLKNKRVDPVFPPQHAETHHGFFSASGQYFALDQKGVSVYSQKGEYITKINGSFTRILFSPDGEGIALVSPNGVETLNLEASCGEAIYKVAVSPTAECNNLASVGAQPGVTYQDLKSVSQAMLCENPFDETAWINQNPVPPKSNVLSEAQALSYLLQFQKKGGFSPEKHLEILNSILSSKSFLKKHPGVVADMIYGELLVKYPAIVQMMRERMPAAISRLERSPDLDESRELSCRTKAELKDSLPAVQRYFEQRAKELEYGSKLSDWDFARALAPALKELPAREKERLRDQMSESMRKTARHGKYSSMYPSRLYYYIYAGTADLFGEPKKTNTELETAVGMPVPSMVVGTDPISLDGGNQINDFGFYSAHLRGWYPSGSNESRTFEWTHAGKKIRAELYMTKSNTAKKVERSSSPDYKKMWEDRKLVGSMVVGANFEGSDSNSVVRSSLIYYQGQGYLFGKPESIKDAKGFLQKGIQSGEIDYLVKQEHAYGDDRNTMTVSPGWRVTGTKKRPDGREEVIHVLYPGRVSKTQPVPHDEFGEWIRSREAGGNPLIYINGSCNSTWQAQREMNAADSKLLVDIASPTLNYCFSSTKGNVVRNIVDGILNESTYPEIRKVLGHTSTIYRDGVSSHFIFPDEPAYESEILSRMRGFYSSKVTMTADGAPYEATWFQKAH